MTAQPSIRRMLSADWRQEWTDDARQLVAVVLIALIALAVGYGIKGVATSATRTVTAGGVTASIPTSWVYQPGAQDLLFSAVDPRNPGQRYSVTKPSLGGTDAAAVADATVGAKTQLLTQFQVLSRATVSVNGKDVPSVTFVYVTTRNGTLPQVIEGRDVFIQGSSVLIVTLESPTKTFDNALDTFGSFAASVKG
jgi:hypothetical protein